jgi:AbrB family looped-hinge helix DNA binding protein
MPVTKVDEKGRVVLPSELRQKLGISTGDEFIVEELGPDSLVLKKVNLRALMQDIIEKARNIDMDKLEAEIEEEANRLARRKYKILD